MARAMIRLLSAVFSARIGLAASPAASRHDTSVSDPDSGVADTAVSELASLLESTHISRRLRLPPDVLAGVFDSTGLMSASSVAKVSPGSREDVKFWHRIRPLDKIWQAYQALAQVPLANYQRALNEGRGLDRNVRWNRLPRNTPREFRRHIPSSGSHYPDFADEFTTNRARAFLLHWAEEGSAAARGTGGAGRRKQLGGFFFDTDLLLQMGEHRDAGITVRLREGTTVRILGDAIQTADRDFRERQWGGVSDVNPVAQALINGSFADKPDRVDVGEGHMITTNDQTGDEGIGKVVCMFHRCGRGVCEQIYVVDVPYWERASRRSGRVLSEETRFLIDVPARYLRFLAPVAVDRNAGVQLGAGGAQYGGSVRWDDTRLPFEVAGGGRAAEADAEEERCRAKWRAGRNMKRTITT